MKQTRFRFKLVAILISIALGILLTEVIYGLLIKNDSFNYKWMQRYMLYQTTDNSAVFRNFKGSYLYLPNKVIRHVAYYDVEGKWVKEYDYLSKSNNWGLLQKNDLKSELPSLLILGDSYTEGQGAPPWTSNIKLGGPLGSYQVINGGIMGTGWKSWASLEESLVQENVQIKKLVVIFISSDLQRDNYDFPKRTLLCMQDFNNCRGDENFYGIPPDAILYEYLGRLRQLRVPIKTPSIRDKARTLLPVSTSLYRAIKTPFMKVLGNPNYPRTEEEVRDLQKREATEIFNLEVIDRLISKYKEDVLFIHLPTKGEIFTSRIEESGKRTRNQIYKNNGLFFDGFSSCGLDRNDFFRNDGHPNVSGYNKIEKCVTRAISETWKG